VLFSQKIKVTKGGIKLAKKYNKGREQKPNYSKRGKRIDNTKMEASRDFDFEEKLRQEKNNICDSDSSLCSRDWRK